MIVDDDTTQAAWHQYEQDVQRQREEMWAEFEQMAQDFRNLDEIVLRYIRGQI